MINKLKLAINTFFCSNKLISNWVVRVKYEKEIDKLIKFCEEKRYFFKREDLIEAIFISYYTANYKDRLFLQDHIDSFYMVPESSAQMKKSQPRNAKCNCGSAKKFKHCCFKKY